MSNVHKLVSRSHPAYLEEMIDKANWTGIAQALDSGLSSAIEVNGWSLMSVVLSAFDYHNPPINNSRVAIPDYLESAILSSLNKDIIFDYGKTPISLAIRYGQWSLAKKMLDQGYIFDTKECSALISAIDGYIQMSYEAEDDLDDELDEDDFLFADIQQMLEADPSDLDCGYAYCVIGEIERDNLSMFFPLFKEYSSDWPDGDSFISMEDKSISPMLLAIVSKVNFLVEMFLEHGISPNYIHTTNYDGKLVQITAVDLAIKEGNSQALGLLLSSGFSWKDAVGSNRSFYFSKAIRQNDNECLSILIDFCPSNYLEEELSAAIHVAASQGDIESLDMLIKSGADINTTSPSGFTIFHQAALNGQIDMIERILSLGLSWSHQSDNGVTPRDLLSQNHKELLSHFNLGSANDAYQTNIVMFPTRKMSR